MTSDTNDYGTAQKLPQYIAALSVCLGAVAAGTVLGWTANISSALATGKLNDVVADPVDAQGWIGSFTTLGAMIVCAPIGFLCDIIGRKLAMLLTIIPFTVGWLLIIFCSNLGMIFAGRFLLGIAGGAFCVAAPLYTSEICTDDIRGTLGSFFQLLLVVGILISYIMGAYVEIKAFSIVCAIIPIIFGVVFYFQPETPVYLAKNNKFEDAHKSLKKLHGKHHNCDKELDDIKVRIETERNSKVSFKKAIQTKAAKKGIFICFGLMFFQQLGGINAFVFYTGSIFESAGSSIAPEDATIIVGVVQVVATLVSSMIVDKFGRKILLLISDLLMMVSGFILAIYFTLKDRNVISAEAAENIGFIPIAAVIVFFTVFSLGYGPIPWLASSEIMPQDIKANASSAAAVFNWFLAFLVTKFYLNLTEAIGGDTTIYIFSAVSLVGTAFVYFMVPETKGKSSEEIQKILNGEKKRSEGRGARSEERGARSEERGARSSGIDNKAYES